MPVTVPAGFAGIKVDNAGKPYSFSEIPGGYRFETRQGDHFSGDALASTERNEICDTARYPISELVRVRFKLLIEPGAPITSKWVVLGQLHSGLSVTPPVEIKFNGSDIMAISGKSGSSSKIIHRDLWRDTGPVQRGHEYDFRFEIEWGVNARIWRDGVLITDYSGPLGYTDQFQTYWRQGIYRSVAAETLAIQVKDLSIEHGAYLPALPAPSPKPDPVATAKGQKFVADMKGAGIRFSNSIAAANNQLRADIEAAFSDLNS